jgi:hypothetical protein
MIEKSSNRWPEYKKTPAHRAKGIDLEIQRATASAATIACTSDAHL